MYMSEQMKVLVNTVMAIGVLSAAAWANEAPAPQQVGNITFITGGIGSDERKALESTQSNYNLQIMNSNKARELQSGGTIKIKNAQGQELVTTSSGPIFYAKVPEGSYNIEETAANGTIKTQNVKVSANQPAKIHFTWED